jgi:hypothetical protein
MLVIIGLARADYDQLLHKVPSDVPAFAVLRHCPELARWGREEPLFKCVIIGCNPDEPHCFWKPLSSIARKPCRTMNTDLNYHGLSLCSFKAYLTRFRRRECQAKFLGHRSQDCAYFPKLRNIFLLTQTQKASKSR